MVPLRSQSGFSLVELSIVLVILGLLTGGILGGQSLIRAAELRSVTADFQRYTTAVYTFRDKYFAVPGDMTNATAFWGFAAGTVGNDATCFDASQTGMGTCNGNGDGNTSNGTASTNNQLGEAFHAWKHLANAGLIEGTYTGYRGPVSIYDATIGVNVPRSRISNAGFMLWYGGAGYTDANWFPMPGKPLIIFGGESDSITEGPVLKPEEAWNIDTKLDDGTPGLGSVRTYKNSCVSTTDPATAVYQLSLNGNLCNVYAYLN